MNSVVYIFKIEDTGSSRSAIGDRLSITPEGALRIKLGRTLVGVIQPDSWRRVTLEKIIPTTEEGTR